MEQGKMMRYLEDAVILAQGSQTAEMYKIISGEAAIYFNYGASDEYLVGILSSQRCFGEISLLCNMPSIYTVVAVNDVLLLRITQEDFPEFIKNNYQNAIDIMKNLANSLVTLSFNLNQLTGELAAQCQIDPQKMEEIVSRIQKYTTRSPAGGSLFTVQL